MTGMPICVKVFSEYMDCDNGDIINFEKKEGLRNGKRVLERS